ncbi:putative 3-methyladenine DNA glycosylase isoform X2 [Pecten maximus]|nr:putative 3-methyladenine DNA glycosylase isoform X2 [Pecten maximus]
MSDLKRKAKAKQTDSKIAKKQCLNEETDKTDSVKSRYFDTDKEELLSPGPSCTVQNSGFEADKRLSSSFYKKSCLQLARNLLGQVLVRRCPTSGGLLCGKVVETEAYLGNEDKAAHSYKGKKTEKNSAMFMDPGTAYVYNIYGMYCCFNISSEGEGAAVLLRAIEPIQGLEAMTCNRSNQRKEGSKALKTKDLCNGPSKFCQALAISKNAINKQDLVSSPDIWMVAGDQIDDQHVVNSKRINIGYAEEFVDKPYRFYILDNKCVSVRDKKAEELLRSG